MRIPKPRSGETLRSFIERTICEPEIRMYEAQRLQLSVDLDAPLFTDSTLIITKYTTTFESEDISEEELHVTYEPAVPLGYVEIAP
jgi:hypothetical protein